MTLPRERGQGAWLVDASAGASAFLRTRQCPGACEWPLYRLGAPSSRCHRTTVSCASRRPRPVRSRSTLMARTRSRSVPPAATDSTSGRACSTGIRGRLASRSRSSRDSTIAAAAAPRRTSALTTDAVTAACSPMRRRRARWWKLAGVSAETPVWQRGDVSGPRAGRRLRPRRHSARPDPHPSRRRSGSRTPRESSARCGWRPPASPARRLRRHTPLLLQPGTPARSSDA